MFHDYLKKALASIIWVVVLGYVRSGSAHDAGTVMDSSGTVAAFTGYALVTCFDNGNGPADHLLASVKDLSRAQDGLLVNLQIIKGNRAISTTDPVSGDANFSPEVKIHGGNGTYLLLVNKTKAGARSFAVSYHCITTDNRHTGTDIEVQQFE
ncbi:MAG: hypothetical protein K2Y09_03935 [Nitrosomonas sp.]|uniref:hypothetical protein n=1 Tax=Nitrosomonas sp. TaxID=42353 RepID=UPI001E023AD2|nr:hypothetical protein [Nitrosomonas sp.]MBX9894316.1 hypothetical protein [Nitrosomonas sp.]